LRLPIFVSLVYLFLYLPIIVLVVFSFNSGDSYSWSGFTLQWYKELFQTKEIWSALINSLIVGISAVTLSVLLSVFMIWGLYQKLTSQKINYLISIFYITMIVPDIVIATSLLVFFYFFHVSFSLATLIVGHTILGLGFAVPIIYSRYKELDKRVVEASLDLGASDLQTFFYVIVPFLYPALLSSALTVFVVSLDDFLISFFCAGSSSQTLSLYIFAVIRQGLSPILNALSTLILAGSSLLVFIFTFLKLKSSSRKL